MELSIIMPVYKAERYVERAIVSCLNQDIESEEYEIIAINDGSPDGSMAILERMAALHPNVRVAEQENQGPGAARNRGLEMAQGEYIWFVDSDDWIEPNCLGEVIGRLTENNLDALVISARETDGQSSKPIIDLSKLEGRVYGSHEIVYKMAIDLHPQITLYRRSILQDNRIRFMEGIVHEDNEFIPRAYYPLRRIGVWNAQIYNIYLSDNSITRTINPKRSYNLLTVCRSLAIFANKVEKGYRKHLYKCIAISLNTSMLCATTYSKEERKAFAEVLHHNKILFNYLFLSLRPTFMIEGYIMSLFPKRAIDIYEFFNKLMFHHKV